MIDAELAAAMARSALRNVATSIRKSSIKSWQRRTGCDAGRLCRHTLASFARLALTEQ